MREYNSLQHWVHVDLFSLYRSIFLAKENQKCHTIDLAHFCCCFFIFLFLYLRFFSFFFGIFFCLSPAVSLILKELKKVYALNWLNYLTAASDLEEVHSLLNQITHLTC